MAKVKYTIPFLVILLLMIFPSSVFAADDSPDSITISNVQAFRNLAESGDVLILFHYSMPYTTYPDTYASDSIIYRLMNTDNTTVLQTSQPYVYPYFDSNGYGEGVGSFYFTASDNLTWGLAYNIDMFTNVLLTPYIIQSYTIDTTDYVTETTQTDNRDLVEQWVFLESDGLEADYSDTGIILITTSDVGLILSPYGEAYFRGAIPGLQSLAPELFFIQTMVPEVMSVTPYDLSVGDTYADRLVGDDLGEGFDNMPGIFGMNKYAFWGLGICGLTIAACVWCSRKGWGIEIGLGTGVLAGICLSLLIGDVIFGIIMLGSLGAAIGIVYLLILRKA